MRKAAISMFLIIILSSLILAPFFTSAEGPDTIYHLDLMFPDPTMVSESQQEELAIHFLEKLDLDTKNTSVHWRQEEQSRYGNLGFTTYQYNLSDEDSLVMYYASSNFASLELDSEWGVDLDIYDCMDILFKVIGFSDEDDYILTYQEVPMINPKGEIRGYRNTSTISNGDGYSNSNRITFNEVVEGEFRKSKIEIDAWYEGNSFNQIDRNEMISDISDEYNSNKPDHVGDLVSGWLSAGDGNKTFFHYPDNSIVAGFSLFFQHEDPEHIYQISGYYDIVNGSILSSSEDVLANSSAYWPEDTHPADPDVSEGFDPIRIIPFLITLLVSAILLVFLTFVLLARRKVKGILDMVSRKRIYEYIRNNPGTHFRQIMRDLDMKQGVMGYHVNILEHEGYVRSISEKSNSSRRTKRN